ncbi:glycosyltransferase family 1 protein [Collybiopsis luxurians FD-317 M1]|uniref:Glycosyltransferase family 1 protein n=1 Tax=Collybiopsis luxurians FD-317 M1 TaxID=944289 RepID=A0A0D0AR58_9AGAR|nr:glycosyltransferase family 1 protein [Collybiopsis luxurians FD-317 M1]
MKWHACVGNTVSIAGVNPHYDYEWFPQKSALMDVAANVEKTGSIYVREADGLVCVSASVFEPEATAAVKEWFASRSKTWYSIGPLSIEGPEEQAALIKTEADAPVEEFLNRIQSEFGSKSLIYISFGTFFWPIDQDRVWAVIDALLAKRQPFLFSHPSPFAQLSDEMKQKIVESGIGMELPWSPQELILAHPVTGWFLTHGGWNSLQEALKYCVPLIFWPFQADQPYNALRLTTLKAGFELIEVRTGELGTRIPHRCKELPKFTAASAQAEVEQLINQLKGEEGLAVRANFKALGDAMGKQWGPTGQSRMEFELLVNKYV